MLTDFIYSQLGRMKNRSNSYKNSFRTVADHIKKFQTHTGIILYLDNVTEDIGSEFIHFLTHYGRLKKEKGKPEGLMSNTVTCIWWRVSTVLRKAEQQGHKVNVGFENVTTEREDANAIYLTVCELNKLNELKNLSKEAKAVRDRFLLGCYTALRFGDYSQLNSGNIVGDKYIEVKTRKTGARVVIPVHPVVRKILKRNGGDFPALPSQQSFGATIKRVCKKAGIDEPVLYERTIGGRVVRKRVKKYELVSSHTARRTGATNMYLAGIPTFRVMLLTGHTTEQSFFKYIRIQREENARTLSEHPFFK